MIADYSELIVEATERTGLSGVANRAHIYVGMAEKALSKSLRLEGMETENSVITDVDGRAALFADYQEMRVIRVGSRVLMRKPVDMVKNGACGYAVIGNTLLSSAKEQRHDLVYYAAIPGLEANNSNWLLDDEPEIYLQAVLFQIYAAQSDVEKAQVTDSYLQSLIEQANMADHLRRHATTRIVLEGVTP